MTLDKGRGNSDEAWGRIQVSCCLALRCRIVADQIGIAVAVTAGLDWTGGIKGSFSFIFINRNKISWRHDPVPNPLPVSNSTSRLRTYPRPRIHPLQTYVPNNPAHLTVSSSSQETSNEVTLRRKTPYFLITTHR